MTARSLHAIRRDHGYNPTPQWTFVARIFSATLPTDDEALSLIAGLDVLLLAGAMALVFATYSTEVGCFVLAIAGLGFGWHYTYLGAFLRLDWWAAVLAAVCLLKRERFALAGACIGYATLSRLFPGALLIGPAVVAVRELRAGATPRWAARLSAGFVIAVVIGLSAGSLAGRGPNAWVEFADRIDRHMGTWTTNAVGLRQVVANDPGYIVARINDPNLERNVGTRMTHRGPLRALLATVLCAMAVGLMWRLAPADAAIAGIVCVFALTAPSSYYWILLALLPMYQRTEPSLALLAFFVGLFACELVLEGVEHLPTHYALMSWGLFFFLFGWLLVALRDVLSPVGSRETDG
jgi:hypothetical protein